MDPREATRRVLESLYSAHGLQSAAHRAVISHLLIEAPRLATENPARCRNWDLTFGKDALPVSEYSAAIADMIRRDLACVIDDAEVDRISSYMRESPALGPTDGMPALGTLQISVRLARTLDELWRQSGYDRPGPTWANDWTNDWPSDGFCVIYSQTRDGCLAYLREELDELNFDEEQPVDPEQMLEIVQIVGPTSCGPWRSDWWSRYDNGYVLAVRHAYRAT